MKLQALWCYPKEPNVEGPRVPSRSEAWQATPSPRRFHSGTERSGSSLAPVLAAGVRLGSYLPMPGGLLGHLGAREHPRYSPYAILITRNLFRVNLERPLEWPRNRCYGSNATGGRKALGIRAFTSGVNHGCTDIVAYCCVTQAWTTSANGAHSDGWAPKICIRCSSFPAK